jgi:hypothetical protein
LQNESLADAFTSALFSTDNSVPFSDPNLENKQALCVVIYVSTFRVK